MSATGPPTGRRTHLLAQLTVTARRWSAACALLDLAVADRLGLHPTDVQCLTLLGLEPGAVTIGRVGELTGLSTGAATRLVDRLERAGYVTRERDGADRRRVLVSGVPARMAAFEEVWEELGRAWRDAVADQDEEHLSGLLDHMRQTVDVVRGQTARLRGASVPPQTRTESPPDATPR